MFSRRFGRPSCRLVMLCRGGWPSATLLQADLPPEDSASLVALAGRSQPGRKGYVNSRILANLNTFNQEIRELTYPLRRGSLAVDRATREAETDPTEPHHAGTAPSGPGPFPSEPGPPE